MIDENRMIYFVVGFALGTVAGILLAPKAGAETRNDIQDKMREGSEYVKRRGQDLQHTAAETVARGKQTLQNQIQSLSDAVEAAKQTYREKVEIGSSHVA